MFFINNSIKALSMTETVYSRLCMLHSL